MYTFFVILHVLVSLILIMVVLLQTGKGAGMGAAFGGASQTLFGTRGQTTFMQKLTATIALLFMVLSVTLASLSSRSLSELEEDVPKAGQEAGMAEEPGEEGAGTGAGEEKPAEKAQAPAGEKEEPKGP